MRFDFVVNILEFSRVAQNWQHLKIKVDIIVSHLIQSTMSNVSLDQPLFN